MSKGKWQNNNKLALAGGKEADMSEVKQQGQAARDVAELPGAVPFELSLKPLSADDEKCYKAECVFLRIYVDEEARRGLHILYKSLGTTTPLEALRVLLRRISGSM